MSKPAEWIRDRRPAVYSVHSRPDLICVGDVLRDCGYPSSVRYAADVDVIDWPDLVSRIATPGIRLRVFSAAFSHNFDCVEISQLLSRGNFRGQYRVVAPSLPDPEIIQREVKGLCPKLDFAVLNDMPAEVVSRN